MSDEELEILRPLIAALARQAMRRLQESDQQAL